MDKSYRQEISRVQSLNDYKKKYTYIDFFFLVVIRKMETKT